MFWEKPFPKDINIVEAVKEYYKLITTRLSYIFEDNGSYKDIRSIYAVDEGMSPEDIDVLADYLLLLLMANSRYLNAYIKKYAEKYYKDVEKKLPNHISVWEFIPVAAQSRNNDLHLERLELVGGKVYIFEVKSIFAREYIRVKLKKLAEEVKEKSKENELLQIDEVKKAIEEIENYLKDKVKYGPIGSIKALNYKGTIPLEWHPPCIRGILHDILSGGSPSHYARRSFVVYWFCAKFNPNLRPLDKEGNLINISATDITSEENIEKFIDEVIEIFKNVEDFDENKTRYYIMHNIGYKVGHGRFTHCEYCKNWKNKSGLSYYCNPDEICKKRNIIHPLDYLCYNIQRHAKKDKKEDGGGDGA